MQALIGIFALLGNEYEGTESEVAEGIVSTNRAPLNDENDEPLNGFIDDSDNSDDDEGLSQSSTNSQAANTTGKKKGKGKGKGYGKGGRTSTTSKKKKTSKGARSIGKKTALPVLRALCRIWRRTVENSDVTSSSFVATSSSSSSTTFTSSYQNVNRNAFLDFMISEFEHADNVQIENNAAGMTHPQRDCSGGAEKGTIPVFVRSLSEGTAITSTSLIGYYYPNSERSCNNSSYKETPLVEISKCKRGNNCSPSCSCLYCKTVPLK